MKRKYLQDTKKSAVLFTMIFVLYSLVYMTKNCFSAAMASIVAEGIMTKSQTGLIAAAFYLVYAPFQIVGGIAADKYPPERLILLGVCGAGIANISIYFTTSYIAMIIIWSCNAIVQFGVWPSVFKIITTELAEKHRVSGIFYINMSGTGGLLLSYVIAIFMGNWKNNFLVSAIVLFALAVIFSVIYFTVEKSMTVEEITPQIKEKKEKKDLGKPIFLLILESGVPLLLIVYVIQSILNLGMKAIAPVMFMESYEYVNDSLANALNIILVLAAPVGVILSGNPFLRRFNPPAVIAALLAVSVPFLLLVTFIGKINIFVIIIALTLIMFLMAAVSIFVAHISRKFVAFGCVGTVSGLFNCMSAFGIVISNYVFTRLSDKYGWEFTTKCWFVLLIVAVVLAVVSVPVWKRFNKKYVDAFKI